MTEVVTVDVTAIGGLTRAEIDMQVATARRYPRNIDMFLRTSKALVTLDEETAMSCIYSLERKSKNRSGDEKKAIEGPSIRMAEILQHTWGNARSGARIVDESDNFITAQGIFHDLESNSAITMEVQRRIVGAKGERYGIDMIGVTGAAAAKIALRNAITTGIPRPYYEPLITAAKAIIAGDARTLAVRREKALEIVHHMGISPEELFAYLDIRSQHDIDGQMLIRVRGIITSLRDGDLRVEDVRPRKQQTERPRADLGAALKGGANRAAEAQDGRDGEPASGEAAKTAEPFQAPQEAKAKAPTTVRLGNAQADALMEEFKAALESAATEQEVAVTADQFAAAIEALPINVTVDFNTEAQARREALAPNKAARKL